jgi:F0F1-type ATP synthase assembly protein I
MKKNAKSYKEIYGGVTGKTLNLGLMVGVSIAVCTFMGYKVDFYFHCTPKGIIGGCLFGIVAGFINMWEQLSSMNKTLDEENAKRKENVSKD